MEDCLLNECQGCLNLQKSLPVTASPAFEDFFQEEQEMSRKKTLKALLSAAMALSLVSVNAFAASSLTSADHTGVIQPMAGSVIDEDGVVYDSMSGVDVTAGAGWLTMDTVMPKSEIYIKLDDSILTNDRGIVANTADLGDNKLFSFNVDKKTNSKLVNSITLVTEKSINKSGRHDWIKIVLNDATMTTEQKFEGTVTFRARKTSDSGAPDNKFLGEAYSGDTYKLKLNIWINNKKITDGDNPDAGDRVYFEPTDGDTNTIVWGDDLAALTFDAVSDADKFYARLSTKSSSEIYSKYGDPANADLYFFDFVGNPVVSSTSRATLTLGIPWDTSDDYTPDPASVYIYQITSGGKLIDVSNQFTYSEDDQEIEGWSTRTRTLGSYVVSDVELDLDKDETVKDEDSDNDGSSSTDKDVPNTGASELPAVAVALGALTMAAAAVSRKMSK